MRKTFGIMCGTLLMLFVLAPAQAKAQRQITGGGAIPDLEIIRITVSARLDDDGVASGIVMIEGGGRCINTEVLSLEFFELDGYEVAAVETVREGTILFFDGSASGLPGGIILLPGDGVQFVPFTNGNISIH